MATVFNWQLNRDMDYQYDEARPSKQIAWVFDLNKCIACQTCTIACKNAWTAGRGQEYMFWNNVESKPMGGYPLAYDLRILEQIEAANGSANNWSGDTYGGTTIFEDLPAGERMHGFIPEDLDYAYPNLGEDEVQSPMGLGDHLSNLSLASGDPWMFYIPRICNHCSFPGCLAACPRGAIYKREEDGIVLIDQDRCRGYRECVRACPYKKTFFRSNTGTSEKCIACFPFVEQGMQTQCVQNCIGRIRLNGFITPHPGTSSPGTFWDSDNPMDWLIYDMELALPLYPQLGLEPNVYYMPPMHLPPTVLTQMFGPKAVTAVDKLKAIKAEWDTAKTNDELPSDTNGALTLSGLSQLFGSTDRIVARFEMTQDSNSLWWCRGWDITDSLVSEIPIFEPQIVRTDYDADLDIPRLNIT